MPEPSDGPEPVVIVGGGWAGLATAITLTRHGIPVHLIEAARQPGGRARSVRSGDLVVDNGQHLMIGAYQSMLTLLGQIGVDADEVFERLPLALEMRDSERRCLSLRAPRLPAPWHLLAALLTVRGLSAADQLKAIRFGRYALSHELAADEDISVLALLHSQGQSAALVRKLWEPLCIATLNAPIDIASARLFLRVLHTSFSQHSRHSDLLIPRCELSDLLPRPGLDFLERQGATIELGQRVTALDLVNDKVQGVYIGDRYIECSRLVLATPPLITRRLLGRHSSVEPLVQQLAALGNEPVTTLYLQYPETVRTKLPMIGLQNTTAQWLFDRRVCGQPGLMAVVISARGEHMTWDTETLTARVRAEIADCFPDWPAPRQSRLIREKRATFCSGVGIDLLRPGNYTAVPGLWLAGDYTDTGLPATLESAVRSGIACAHAIRNRPAI